MSLGMLLALTLLGLFLLALILVIAATLWPRRHPFRSTGRSAEEHRAFEVANGVVFDQNFPFTATCFDMNDGGRIAARMFGPEDAPDIIVLVHGLGAAGARWNNPAGLLSAATGAQVIAVDLRGHNESSGRRHDLDRIGQYEDDLAQVVVALQSDRPGARVWLAGHSMGGGIALRFALKPDRPRVAGYLLFAPVFGPGPTMPGVSPADSALRIDRMRMTGLMILNLLGIRNCNHLPVAYLNASPEFPAYSFTALASGLPLPPGTAQDALSAMEGPFLIIAGAEDTFIRAEGYREVAATQPHGRVEILPGHGHDSFLNDRETHAIVAHWLEAQRVQLSKMAPSSGPQDNAATRCVQLD